MEDTIPNKPEASLNQRFMYLYCALFFILPFGQRFPTNLAFTIILIFSLLTLKKKDWLSGLKSPLWWAPALFFSYYALSMLWSEEPGGWQQLQTKLGFLCITYVILSSWRLIVPKVKETVLKWYTYGNAAVLTSAFAIAIYRALSSGSLSRLSPGGTYRQNYFTYETLSEPFMHPGYLCTYIGLALLACIYFIWKSKGSQKWLWSILLVYFFFGMVMLQGRINLLALFAVIGIGGIVLAFKKRAYKWLAIPLLPAVLLLAFVFLAPKSIKDRYLQFPKFDYDISGTNFNSATYRLAEWSCALDVINNHPVTGTGVADNHAELLQVYKKRHFNEGLKNEFNCHNQYIETTLATGYLGLIILLGMFGIYLWWAFRTDNYLLAAGLAFFMLSMLTESMLERAWAILLFTAFFPFFASSKKA